MIIIPVPGAREKFSAKGKKKGKTYGITVPRLELHPMQELDGRDQERQSLARTRTRRTKHVLPREERRYRLLLNRRHSFEAHLV